MLNPKRLNELSIFFPLYNEEKNVIPLVLESVRIFPKIAEKFEIILINDGSVDDTRTIAERLSSIYEEVRVVTQENKGYGGAVKRGFKESKYQWVFYSDADLQFRLEELKKFLPYVRDYDLIIGYRENRAEGFKRKLMADLLKVWNYIFLGFPLFIRDIDCAFKLINKEVIDSVGELESEGAMFSTEFLFKACKRGFKLKQVGVTHYKRKYGKSTGNSIKVMIKAVKETFVLRNTLPRDVYRPKYRPAYSA